MKSARRILWGVAVLFLGVLAAWVLAAVFTSPVTPRPVHPFWAGPAPRVIAHRGGRGLWPENTLHAFRQAHRMGADVLEMDIRRSADGELVVLHDATVDRTTDGTGAVAALTQAELARLDAGYRWTGDGGASFPYRGRGIGIPALVEVLRNLPQARLNLEIKPRGPGLSGPLCAAIRTHGAQARVAVASFDQEAMDAFRLACPEVATSATRNEVLRFVLLRAARLEHLHDPRAGAFQVPERVNGWALVTPGFVIEARRSNQKVEIWVVNDPGDMARLLRLPADGVMTDYPDKILALLGR